MDIKTHVPKNAHSKVSSVWRVMVFSLGICAGVVFYFPVSGA